MSATDVPTGIVGVSVKRARDAGQGADPIGVKQARAKVSSVAWLPKEGIDYGDWETQGHWLGSVARCSQWWIGDWARFGTAKYGEKYARASEISGYDEHSLRNMAYVASRFADPSRRRDSLSWSHHAELAPLEPGEQDEWLRRAERRKLSVAALRKMLREDRATPSQATDKPPQAQSPKAPDVVVCPKCGDRIAIAGADASDR